MSIARHHAEWLSLVEVSGPFLSMPVLLEAFRDGLEAHNPDHHRLQRLAHDEWEAKSNDPAMHNAWVRFVLRKTLDYAPEALFEGQAIPQTLHAEVAEQHEILKPDHVLKEPASAKPRLLIQTYPATQELTKPVPGLSWKADPDTRMTELLHATDVRLGLPKEQWQLKPARELLNLKICDMACGSGAFLVQACRYLSERLLEAWAQAEKEAQIGHQDTLFQKKQRTAAMMRITPYGMASQGGLYEQLVPLDLNERLTHARRIIAQRCLYGVDKNPLAVERAKLSLWLLTLAKDKPFEFLDHAIRCGDSLVGIHHLDQLKFFNLDPSQGRNLFTGPIFDLVDEAVALRQKIEAMPSNTVEDMEAQEKLLAEAEQKTARLRCAADLLLSVEFQGASAADKQSLHDSMAIQAGHHVDKGTIEEFRQAVRKALKGQQTFHWALEFQQVFQKRGGFDAIVGNPPFMGSKYWASNVGEHLVSFSVHILGSRPGHSDICALFHRRALQLLSLGGCSGLIGCDSLREGDSWKVGLNPIATQATIFRAYSSLRWPGSATVRVCLVWASKAQTITPRFLDDMPTPVIDGRLMPGDVFSDPKPLRHGLVGGGGCHNAKGDSLILTEAGPWMLRLKEAKSPYLRRYITGEDLNDHAFMNCDRWVVYTGDESLDQVTQCCSVTRSFLDEVVAPIRTPEYLASFPGLSQRWWQFHRPAADLFREVSKKKHYIVLAMVSKYIVPARVPSSWISTNKFCVIAEDRPDVFAVLLSNLAELWIRTFSGSLGETLSISLTKAIQTFPLPSLGKLDWYTKASRGIEALHQEFTRCNQVGYTDLYNRFHDPDESCADIQKLRQLHVEMDHAVAAAFGWTDLDLGHGFHQTKQGLRYTISESARREVLARLLKLNHERYAEEVRQGLHEKKKPRNTRKTRNQETEEGGLFG